MQQSNAIVEISEALHLSSNKIVHIDNPALGNGKKCGCVCLICGRQLIAVNGKDIVIRAHFKHNPEDTSNCSGFAENETALHVIAKNIIFEHSQILLPSGLLRYNKANFEYSHRVRRFVKFRSDITLFSDEKLMCHVEIVVTNPMTLEKIEFYKRNAIKCVVIDLQSLESQKYEIDITWLREILIESISYKSEIAFSDTNDIVGCEAEDYASPEFTDPRLLESADVRWAEPNKSGYGKIIAVLAIIVMWAIRILYLRSKSKLFSVKSIHNTRRRRF